MRKRAPARKEDAMKTFYVSPNGNDQNTGTSNLPFRTIQKGVDELSAPGDKLIVKSGVYTESVEIVKKRGSARNPIIIEGELDSSGRPTSILQASITGKVFQKEQTNEVSSFHLVPGRGGNNQWGKNQAADAHVDEYISKRVFPSPTPTKSWRVNSGAFINPINGRYVRLVSYGQLEFLRSDYEFNPRVSKDLYAPAYMGPGIHFNQETNRIHIRLSHTSVNQNINPLSDYQGETNPNKVALSICTNTHDHSNFYFGLRCTECSDLQIRNLSVRFGDATVLTKNCSNLLFEGLEIWAGQYGVRLGAENPSIIFCNTVIDGGLPDWLFRSDLKDEPPKQFGNNAPAKQTHETLFLASNDTSHLKISHCEFLNGHDLNIGGTNVTFNNNLISNLHDEGLIMGGDAPVRTGHFHHNVIKKTISALSFVGKPTESLLIYRNLIDLQDPVAGKRPNSAEDVNVWRIGRPFKNGEADSFGSCDIFQNTFIVPPNESNDMRVIDFLRGVQETIHKRTLLNNIFVVLNTPDQPDSIIAFLPNKNLTSNNVEVNGNLYFKKGGGVKLFYLTTETPGSFKTYSVSTDWLTHPFFKATVISRPPGDEKPPGDENTKLFLKDPKFIRLAHRLKHVSSLHQDNLHLAVTSPARKAGIVLPDRLRNNIDLEAPGQNNPDVGCYQAGADGKMPILSVGVHGRHQFPFPEPVVNPAI
jgi:hypothetical protein